MRVERIALAFVGIIVASIASYSFFNYFIERGVQPDIAGGYAIAVFLAVLGAFGLIAVKARI